jgi:hypothetical protein
MKAMKVEFGSKTLELVLDGATIINIEKELRTSLFGTMMTGSGGMKMPRLGEMLTILHESNTKHGIKKADMPSLYDEYVANGGTQMTLFEVIQNLMEAAGFFESEDKTEEKVDGEKNDSLV